MPGYGFGNRVSGGLLRFDEESYAELRMQPSGATGATVPRKSVTSAGSAGVSGTLYVQAILLAGATVINNLNYVTASTAKAGGTHGWYVLLDSQSNVLAVTADQTDPATVWGTINTPYGLPVTQNIALSGDGVGLYYMGQMVAATTMPTFQAAPSLNNVEIATIPPIILGTCGIGYTTPPAVGTNLGAITPIQNENLWGWTS